MDRKPTCQRGHRFTAENTRWRTLRTGHRVRCCRECQRLRNRLRYRGDRKYKKKREKILTFALADATEIRSLALLKRLSHES